jgi:DNA-binding NtrC family response regulator
LAAAMSSSLARVLVVEDEPHVAAVLHDALIDLGYAVQVAVNGAEALRLVPLYRPDVVLLDLALPNMPGDIVLGQLPLADPNLPVIIVTGDADIEPARGAFDYVAKPFDLEILARILAAALVYRG